MAERPTIAYGFFCEFVRAEEQGKTSVLGLWGRRCILWGTPPATLPNLGLHVYIFNPDQADCRGRLRITLPGDAPPPAEIDFDLPQQPGLVGHNLNFNLAGLTVQGESKIEANVTLTTTPPTEATFVLEFVFRPRPSLPPT